MDKYTATWVSHSSISDFLKCPRLYYLRNVYKDSKTGNKITVVSPPLSLGGAVHDVVEALSVVPSEERLKYPLTKSFEEAWKKVSGKVGGFASKSQEEEYKQRGVEMIKKLQDNPQILTNKAIKLKVDLPYFWLSEEDNIILCGKIDWLEYLEDQDAIHIVDFKTGKNEESPDSLQLPIYYLLAKNIQSREVAKISYWYLDSDAGPTEMPLPEYKKSFDKVIEVARRIKLGRQIEHFKCPKGGCFACRPLEQVLDGKGELVGRSQYNQDIYILST